MNAVRTRMAVLLNAVRRGRMHNPLEKAKNGKQGGLRAN